MESAGRGPHRLNALDRALSVSGFLDAGLTCHAITAEGLSNRLAGMSLLKAGGGLVMTATRYAALAAGRWAG